MLKKTLLALATSAALTAPAFAAGFQCDAPVLNVQADAPAQFTVNCRGADTNTLAPVVRFAGEMPTHGTAPYKVKASFALDARPAYAQTMNLAPRADQVATGELTSTTVSLAALPAQFAAHSHWDAEGGVFSLEEKPGRWHVFSVRFDQGDGSPYLVDAGYAHTSVKAGRATAQLLLGKDYSRFAGKAAGVVPQVNAELGLRDGKLEVLVGETRVAGQKNLQAALMQLDKNPKDIARAWAFAAQAKFLGLEDEVRYAAQKVAAHNPQLLEEFQLGLQRIEPYAVALD